MKKSHKVLTLSVLMAFPAWTGDAAACFGFPGAERAQVFSSGRISLPSLLFALGVLLLTLAAGVALGRLTAKRGRAERDVETIRKSLSDSERKYRGLFENANDAIVVLDEDRFIDCNPKAEEVFGASRDELLSSTPYAFSPPRQPDGRPSKEAALDKIEAAFKGEPQFFEWKHKKGDGTPFDAEVSLNAIELSGRNVVQAVVRDVTGRKLAEHALRRSEEKHRLLLENTGLSIVSYDKDSTVLFASRAAAESIGKTVDACVGRPLKDLLPGGRADDLARRNRRIFETGQAESHEETTVLLGRPTTLFTTAYPQKEDSGEVTAVVAVSQDLTEMKTMEEALRKSEAKYRKLFEHANDAILIFNPVTEVILEANPAAEKMYGISRIDLVGMSLKSLTKDVSRGEKQIRDMLKTGSSRNFESVHLKKDGTQMHLLINSSVIEYEGRQAILSVNTDVTEQKRAEEILRQTQERLHRARTLEAVGALANGLAHEVRNPLFAIGVNMAALDKRLESRDEARPYMAFIREHVKRLDVLMRDLIELGHPLGGEAFEPVGLADILEQSRLLVGETLPEDLDRMAIELPENDLPVRGVSHKLTLAFVHILVNAVQNSPAGTPIRVSVRKDRGDAVVSIVDAGTGIPPRLKGRIFDPFVTGRTGQPGLGLALARHFLSAHGGSIEAMNNVPGPGATFIVRIPLEESVTESRDDAQGRS